jgi:hypothetical protein
VKAGNQLPERKSANGSRAIEGTAMGKAQDLD